MSKISIFFVLSLVVLFTSVTTNAANLCEVIRAAKSGEFTPQQLCDAYKVNFCSGLSMSGVICEIGGARFCSSVKTDIEAVCEVQGGRFCSSLNQQDRLAYFNYIQSCSR